MARYGLIAGNGKFPFLVLEAARSQGIEVVVVAMKEETFPEIGNLGQIVYWQSLGQLGKLIETFRKENVTHAIMAGQVKHRQIFSDIDPDFRMLKLLASLRSKNTDALIGGIASVLADEGITLMDSTLFLKPLLPDIGVLTERAPNANEARDIEYGRKLAREIARLDLGQTLVVRDRACVAVEAMEGTDAVIRRAAGFTEGQPMTVIKVSKPNQDMRFDVPVIGLPTVELMAEMNASALAIDAYKTLLIDRDKLVAFADQRKICIVAMDPLQE
jgi:DUF1009 family protein